MCLCGKGCMSMVLKWNPEDNLWPLVLSFHHVGSGSRAQDNKLGSKQDLHPLSHLTSL